MIFWRGRKMAAVVMAIWAAVGSMGEVSAGEEQGWANWGYDFHNTHFAARETRIGLANVHLLAPLWTFKSGYDISATPTVAGNILYITDWASPKLTSALLPFSGGGHLYAIDRNTGEEIWSRKISSYNRSVANDFSRNSPAISGDKIYLGDTVNILHLVQGLKNAGARLMAINRFTGHLVWKTVLDKNHTSQVTQSPIVYEGKVYVGVSSMEEEIPRVLGRLYKCCTFRGSMMALDAETGEILWKRSMVPDSPLTSSGFSGNAVWGSAPVIDSKRGLLYVGTGNNYDVPSSLKECLKNTGDRAGGGRPEESCYQLYGADNNYSDSVVALDLNSGEVKWSLKASRYDAWTVACESALLPWYPRVGGCPSPNGMDVDFAQAPMLLETEMGGVKKDVLVIGQKSGLFWALDPDHAGKVLWVTQVGPGGTVGGHQWGSATDGKRIYTQISNSDHKEYQLEAGLMQGKMVNGGMWAALDPATGKILWQTPVPASFLPLRGEGIDHIFLGKNLGRGFFGLAMGPLTVANGLLFAGSMDGHMHALEVESGRILWSFKTKGSVMSAPSIVDGVVYWGAGYSKYGFGDNTLYAFGLPK